ncbi:hypothetical protein WA026_000496 [Henosepilachna vigintioctopunctata]|uniref:Uncharacterized protein n=1 Tax=Henosepilachna vigintioctopunctata TaxID=420089 RepID=A0AAW1V7E9_9CUCU
MSSFVFQLIFILLAVSFCCFSFVNSSSLHIVLHRAENIFSEYNKFNDAKVLAAEEASKWRETLAKDKNVKVSSIIKVVSQGYEGVVPVSAHQERGTPAISRHEDITRDNTDDEEQCGWTPSLKARPKPAGGVVKPDLKRKSGDNFVRPAPGRAKKPRFNNRPKKISTLQKEILLRTRRTKVQRYLHLGVQVIEEVTNEKAQMQEKITNIIQNTQILRNVWTNRQHQKVGNNYGPGFKYY